MVLTSVVSVICTALLTVTIAVLVLICRSKFKSVVKRADATEDQQIYEQVDGITDHGDRQDVTVSVSLKENEAYGNAICLQSNEAYETVKQ